MIYAVVYRCSDIYDLTWPIDMLVGYYFSTKYKAQTRDCTRDGFGFDSQSGE